MKLIIRCPACKWKPDGGEYWSCSHCHHTWNTFETMAKCPSCKYQYETTQCIEHRGGCITTSLHEDWYEGLDNLVDELKAELTIHNFEIV